MSFAIFLKNPLPRTKGALVCDERLLRVDVTLPDTDPDWNSNAFTNNEITITKIIF